MKYDISRPKIVMIGAGNVAFQYAIALKSAGYNIFQVYSRTIQSAEKLAKITDSKAIISIAEIDQGCDLFIFAVSDRVLSEIIDRIQFSGQMAIHTSGSVSIDIFAGKAQHYGVIYPLQTLSKLRILNMQEVPLLIEANSSNNLLNLQSIAKSMSSNILISDSFQRRQIHLAAVFASNFTNHMYVIANDLLKKSGFSYQILKPIILETALKALEFDNPNDAQTGPAIRKDSNILEKHLEMLSGNKDLKSIYNLISNHISSSSD